MDPFDLRQWKGFSQAGGKVSEPAFVDQITIDSRRIDSNKSVFVALKGEHVDGHQFVKQAAHSGARYALVDASWTLNETIPHFTVLKVSDPLTAFQDIARTYRKQLPTKIIGITGSYGKTMVKDLLYSILSQRYRTAASPESFNSQIGVPLSLLTLNRQHEIAIIEAAISQKGEMDRLVNMIQPDYSILTPLGKKHLVTLEDIETLAYETMKLILSTPTTGWALIPKTSPIAGFQSKLKCPSYFWDTKHDTLPFAYPTMQDFVSPLPYKIDFPQAKTFESHIQNGSIYFFNLLNMSLKAAWLLEASPESIQKVLLEHPFEPTRTEIWKSTMGATFINDTYCSDPQSIDVALKHFNYSLPEQKKIFLFGGLRGATKNQDTNYKAIGKAISKANIDRLVLYGHDKYDVLIDQLSTSNSPVITQCNHSKEALEYLKLTIHQNDLVLIKGKEKISIDLLTQEFNESLNNNQCTINFAAIKTNISTFRKKLPKNTRMMVMVKALAYGTDDIRMAKFLSTCDIDILGVSYVDEGVALKKAGTQLSIFSINAAEYEVGKVVKWGLEVGVSDCSLVEALAKEAEKYQQQVKVHLHIDTGMGRFGCRPEDALNLAKTIISHPSLILEGVMTHFATAEDPNEDCFTLKQVEVFDKIIEELKDHGIKPKWTHAANSSAAIRFNLSQYNMVRLGLGVYGLYTSESCRKNLDLRLALSLTSRIVAINTCKKGDSVSYGRSYKIERDHQKIAVLPIGYYDGIHRNYSGKAYVSIRGIKAPMVGNICMDYMMVDVTDIPNAHVGDKVLIFGEDESGQYLSPEDLASCGNSIIHELITCLGPRIQRIFIYEEGHQIR